MKEFAGKVAGITGAANGIGTVAFTHNKRHIRTS